MAKLNLCLSALLLASGIHLNFALAADDCPSHDALRTRGFVVHSTSDFSRLTRQVFADYESEMEHFVPDMESRLYSGELKVPVLVKSVDDLRTPQSEMYGDLFVIQNLDTGELYELRWYSKGVKHVVYRTLKCATNYVPYAENALF